MKALCITKGEERVVTQYRFRSCLHEVCSKMGAATDTIEVDDNTNLPSFDRTIEYLKGIPQPPIEVSEPSEEPQEETTRETRETDLGEWSSDSRQKAEQIRRRIRQNLLDGQSIAVRDIRRGWDTGLSSGALSRHLQMAISDLESQGRHIIRQGHRYRLQS